jgi:thymidylate kinase
MDEGFIQRGVALVGSGFVDMDVPLLSRYLAAAPMPDVVVVVATPPEACAARLDRRGWSERVSGLTPAQRGAFLAGAIDVVERVTETLATGPVRIIRVDGTRPIADSTRSLAATLTS